MRRISWLADVWSFSRLTLLDVVRLLAFHLNAYYIYRTYCVSRQVEPSIADLICSTSWHNILRDSQQRNTTLATCFCYNWCHGKQEPQAFPEQWMLLFTTVCSRYREQSGLKFLQETPVYLIRGKTMYSPSGCIAIAAALWQLLIIIIITFDAVSSHWSVQ